jgi:hypothetical protein
VTEHRDYERRQRPTELAKKFVDRFPSVFFSRVPEGERFLITCAVADLIRRERAVVFRLRDTASAAAWKLRENPAVAAPLLEAVEFADMADEDRELPTAKDEGEPRDLLASSRIIVNRHGSLNNGWWYHFDFQDDYSGQVFAVTFDTKSGIILSSKLEGASGEQVAAMFAFALEVRRRGWPEQPEMSARGHEVPLTTETPKEGA